MTGQRDTSAEMRLRRHLHAIGLRYRVHQVVCQRPRRTADVVFTRARLAVFVDGCFWHGCPEHGTLPREVNREFWEAKINKNRERDRDTDARLADAEWQVIRIWEHEDPAEAASRVAEAVAQRRP